MPNRSKTDIVERVKLLEEEVYPSGTNTPDTATAGEDGKLDLVNTGHLLPKADEGVVNSVSAALQRGYVAAVHPSEGVAVVDPRDTATDAAALQAANDYLAVKTQNSGEVFVPALKPDGSMWEIESTVVWGDSSDSTAYINPHGVGFNRDVAVGTTISDGSPVFKFVGDTTNGISRKGMRSTGFSFALGGSNATPVMVQCVNNWYIGYERVAGFAATGFQIDGLCTEWQLECNRVASGDTGAKYVDITNTVGTPTATTDGYIGPRWQAGGDHDVGLSTHLDSEKLTIAGKWEGATGRAELDLTGGVNVVTDECHVTGGGNDPGVHGIYAESGVNVLRPAFVSGWDGDGIHVNASSGEFYIDPAIHFSDITGDNLGLGNLDPDHAIIPYESSVVGKQTETVTYPSPPWQRIYHPDGFRLYREDTTTVSGKTLAEGFAGNKFERNRLEWTVAADPGSDAELRELLGWDSANGHKKLLFEELTGTTVDVDWRLYRR